MKDEKLSILLMKELELIKTKAFLSQSAGFLPNKFFSIPSGSFLNNPNKTNCFCVGLYWRMESLASLILTHV